VALVASLILVGGLLVYRIRNDEHFMAAELGESYVNYMAKMIGCELAAALEEPSQTNPVPGISDRRCDPRRITDVSQTRGTRRNPEDTQGHDGAAKQVQEDTGGAAGIRKDTALGRFGTVRPGFISRAPDQNLNRFRLRGWV
jgi:hypothetical protein